MSYKNAGREDIDEAAAAMSMNCAAQGCPMRWSVDAGNGKLCSYHAGENPKMWPSITESLKMHGPWELQKTSNVALDNYRDDPKGWAKRLRDKHDRGEHLTPVQQAMYKAVLKL